MKIIFNLLKSKFRLRLWPHHKMVQWAYKKFNPYLLSQPLSSILHSFSTLMELTQVQLIIYLKIIMLPVFLKYLFFKLFLGTSLVRISPNLPFLNCSVVVRCLARLFSLFWALGTLTLFLDVSLKKIMLAQKLKHLV